jgi:hypothetical protein
VIEKKRPYSFLKIFIPNHQNTHKERERKREISPTRAPTLSLSPREGYAKKKKKMTTTTSAEEEEVEEEEKKNAFQKDKSIIIARKKEHVLNKLNAMHDERAQKRAMVRGQKERDLDPNESLERFACEFKRMVEDIERDLIVREDDDATDDEKKREKKEKSLTKIADLREKVAKSAYFLPKFDAEKSMKTCDGLEKKARADDDARGGGSKEDAATTKKKFSFSAKMKATKTNDGVAAAGRGVEEASSSAAAIERLQKKHREANSLLVVRENKEGETIILTSEECEGRDVTLERLTRCEVTIESCANRKPRSVRMRNLVACEIKATDIDGSAYVENMSDTIAFIGSRQLRVHDATKCQFYCRVASGPIIERCKAVEFAPLSSSSENGEEVEQEEENLWNKVEDFGWIKQEQSPNWSVIEEKNRVAFKVR